MDIFVLICAIWLVLVAFIITYIFSKHGRRVSGPVIRRTKLPNIEKSSISPDVAPSGHHRFPKKPDWVTEEVIHLKAYLPDHGCRKIAQCFNRIHADKEITIGKTYVSEVIRKHQYAIQCMRKNIHNKPPYPIPKNKYWGIDLTQLKDAEKERHQVLGIIEHHSRIAVSITRLKNKVSITLLRAIITALEKHPKPEIIRTDNESVFTSKLFKFGLWFLGIEHQTTELYCPWQNGRIERFFGTLKSAFKRIVVTNANDLDNKLIEFSFWYNHVRPHQSLHGMTPIEAYKNIDISQHSKKAHWHPISFWSGKINGFYPRE